MEDFILKNDFNRCFPLAKGGIIISTKIGNIQFGTTSECILELQDLDIPIPNIYVLPSILFEKKYLINLLELEPIVLYNFLRKNKTILISSKENEKIIKAVFQEEVFGPPHFKHLDEEFHSTFDAKAIPDFRAELSFFVRKKFNISKALFESFNIDYLIDFFLFDYSGNAELNDGVSIKKSDGKFIILEDGMEIAQIKDTINFCLTAEVKRKFAQTEPGFANLALQMNNIKSEKLNQDVLQSVSYCPPMFGITYLGSYFENKVDNKDTGILIWINGRGVIIDPPPFTQEILDQLGIPNLYIEWFILTHCHNTHDAGAFQKILASARVEIITSRTIMNSFLRKYSALTGMPIDILTKLFKFRPIIMGAPLNLNGAIFRFFYTLHSLPTIGCEIHLQDKSIYYSGDTLYDQKIMEELVQEKILTKERYENLIGKKWNNYTVIIHDGEGSEEHTSPKAFDSFPLKVKENMIFFHLSLETENSLKLEPKKSLRYLKNYKYNTHEIKVKIPKSFDYLKKIEILSSIEVFENVSLRNAKDLLHSVKEEHYCKGQLVIKQGTYGNKFYIIIKGVARIFSDKTENQFSRFYYVGDYFGETALVNNLSKRMANVEAISDLDLLVIEKHDFWFVFGDGKGGGGPIFHKLLNLLQARKSKALNAIQKNSSFAELTGSQKTQLEMICQETTIKQNQILWSVGEEAKFGFLIGKGTLKFIGECYEASLPEFETGAFIGEIDSFINSTPSTTSVQAVTDCVIFLIDKDDLLNFFNKNPALYVLFSNVKHFD